MMRDGLPADIVDRAQGSLLGQLIGDALGSQVEFMGPEAIASEYPGGVRDMEDGGTWDTLAGQPTDDSEMALLLARSLLRNDGFDSYDVWQEYRFWIRSKPFDVGGTISAALAGRKNLQSQANGALMRVSPIGIYGAMCEGDDVAAMARVDAALTHPHPICLDVNALYARAIAFAVGRQTTPEELYGKVVEWSDEMNCNEEVKSWIVGAATAPPDSFTLNEGWVKIAFWNALYRLLHCADFEEALVETVMCGGDTDTNAAIAGALLGAVHGRATVPERWVECVLNCRPEEGEVGVIQPRPEVFWPVDALALAENLVWMGREARHF